MFRRFYGSQLILIAIGITLGYLARLAFGGPETDAEPKTSFNHPIVEPVEESIDLPLIKKALPTKKAPIDKTPLQEAPAADDTSGLVPPISIFGNLRASNEPNSMYASLSDFDHDSTAAFEPHGDQVCASGCALSRHPTAELTKSHFLKLLADFPAKPMDETNQALEELLYYGPQTRRMIETNGLENVDGNSAKFLLGQLKYSHAKIAIRVVDMNGNVRTWLDSTSVPFDRRHVFDMQTANLQPLVTSGTVKRVGLNHIWTRL